jgi:hypothetical protein
VIFIHHSTTSSSRTMGSSPRQRLSLGLECGSGFGLLDHDIELTLLRHLVATQLVHFLSHVLSMRPRIPEFIFLSGDIVAQSV